MNVNQPQKAGAFTYVGAVFILIGLVLTYWAARIQADWWWVSAFVSIVGATWSGPWLWNNGYINQFKVAAIFVGLAIPPFICFVAREQSLLLTLIINVALGLAFVPTFVRAKTLIVFVMSFLYANVIVFTSLGVI